MIRTLLFFVFLVLNIVSVEWGFELGIYLTKPLLIPLLAWTLIGFKWDRVRWICLGLLFSWIGDILLMLPIDGFVVGLISFLIAHHYYIRHLFGQWNAKEVPFRPVYLLGVTMYLIVLIGILFPVLGDMKIPVIVYGLVISTMLLFALHTEQRGYQLGALFFVLSDSLLAINKFHTPLPLAGLLVMSTYGLAQYYIVKTSRT